VASEARLEFHLLGFSRLQVSGHDFQSCRKKAKEAGFQPLSMDSSLEQIRADLMGFLQEAYPQLEVRIGPWDEDPGVLEIRFIDEAFCGLYPKQRYHRLIHLIPTEYYTEHLADTVWKELAPGEEPSTEEHLDDDTIADITPDVLASLLSAGFFSVLDDLFSPVDGSAGQACHGDFRNSKSLLPELGFSESDFCDIFDVLMGQGGFCDCEILYNAAESSRLKARYWKARASGKIPDNPHKRNTKAK
jgi:hypothetical protein